MLIGKYKILTNNILVCDYDYLFSLILKGLKNSRPVLICPAATYALVIAYRTTILKNILDKFYLVPDSQWVKWSINFLYGNSVVIKMRATDLMLKTVSFAQKNKLKIFLYGTNKSTLKKLNIELKKNFPAINIVGSVPSKYRKLYLEEKKDIIMKINKSKADIMFVGIGSPLQEKFSYEIVREFPALSKNIAIITVGAAFDFISGVKPQAPKFLQAMGLEWLFRLIDEPKRLSRRYLFYGPIFIFYVLMQKIKNDLNYKKL